MPPSIWCLPMAARAVAVQRLRRANSALGQPITPDHWVCGADIVHAVRREMALTLSDLLIRRTHMFYEVAGQGVREASAMVDIAGNELGWDGVRKADELARYLRYVESQNSFRAELDSGPDL